MRQPLVRAIERARGPGGGIPPFRASFLGRGSRPPSPVRAGRADPSSPVRAGGLFPPSARRQHSCLFSPDRAGGGFSPRPLHARRAGRKQAALPRAFAAGYSPSFSSSVPISARTGTRSLPAAHNVISPPSGKADRLAEGASSVPFSTHPPSCRGLDGKKGGQTGEANRASFPLLRQLPKEGGSRQGKGKQIGRPAIPWTAPHTLLFLPSQWEWAERKEGEGTGAQTAPVGEIRGREGSCAPLPVFLWGETGQNMDGVLPPLFPVRTGAAFPLAFHTAQNVAP